MHKVPHQSVIQLTFLEKNGLYDTDQILKLDKSMNMVSK
jgi:hypothetical protein